jgi:hypothetical protein
LVSRKVLKLRFVDLIFFPEPFKGIDKGIAFVLFAPVYFVTNGLLVFINQKAKVDDGVPYFAVLTKPFLLEPIFLVTGEIKSGDIVKNLIQFLVE